MFTHNHHSLPPHAEKGIFYYRNLYFFSLYYALCNSFFANTNDGEILAYLSIVWQLNFCWAEHPLPSDFLLIGQPEKLQRAKDLFFFLCSFKEQRTSFVCTNHRYILPVIFTPLCTNTSDLVVVSITDQTVVFAGSA